MLNEERQVMKLFRVEITSSVPRIFMAEVELCVPERALWFFGDGLNYLAIIGPFNITCAVVSGKAALDWLGLLPPLNERLAKVFGDENWNRPKNNER